MVDLLKVQDMKKQGKRIRNSWSLRGNRPLEVDAYTNPTLARIGESPIPQSTNIRER